MRLLLAVILMVPVLAQQPDQQPKPDEKAAPAPAKPADAQAAQAPAKAAEQAASPAPAGEQWFTGDIDFGYRWRTDVGGDFLQYRSVVNLTEGPKLFGLDVTIVDPKKRLFDRLDARGYGWGGDPYNTAHVGVRKLGIYDLNFDYRNIAYFDAVPSFANPAAPLGFNEQSFDIHRRTTSVSLDLLPGKHLVPYLAFDRNSGNGRGIETWLLDSTNEYAVPSLLRDSTNNYRGGLRVEFSRFHLTLEQGGTTFKDDDLASFSGTNPGDRTTPALGQTLLLNNLQQAYGIRGDSIYSRALLTANPLSWISFYGQFLFSEPQTTVNYADVAAGNFVELSQLSFYSWQQFVGVGAAHQPHVTGSAGLELRPAKRLRIMESWMTDRYHDAASPLSTQTLAAAGTANKTVTGLNYAQVVNYNQQQTDVLFDLTSKLTLRGGYRRVWGDATVLAGQFSQSGEFASGTLDRNVGLAGLTFRPWEKLSANLDYERGSSDNVYFRNSLNNYDRTRFRTRYQATAALGFQLNLQVFKNQNPSPDIAYYFKSRENSLAVYWTPDGGKRISVMAEYDRSTLSSDINYLGLFLSPSFSAYRDNAHSATSAIDLAIPRLARAKLTLGGSLFVSSGSRPSRFYQPLMRLSLPFGKHVYWNTEWQWYGFGEEFYLYEGFRTHVFMTGLRVTR